MSSTFEEDMAVALAASVETACLEKLHHQIEQGPCESPVDWRDRLHTQISVTRNTSVEYPFIAEALSRATDLVTVGQNPPVTVCCGHGSRWGKCRLAAHPGLDGHCPKCYESNLTEQAIIASLSDRDLPAPSRVTELSETQKMYADALGMPYVALLADINSKLATDAADDWA